MMRARTALAAVLVVGAVAIVGCGSGGHATVGNATTGNASKIQNAQTSDQRASQTANTLRAALGATKSGDFVGNGAQCSLILVTAGASATAYSGDPWVLMSPDHQVAVKVEGSPESECLQAVDHVLGW